MKNNWQTKKLEELCDNYKNDIVDGPFGSDLKRNDYIDRGIPVLKIQNVKENIIEFKNMDYISEEKYKQLIRHSYDKGDIVMTKLGYPLGVCAIVDGIEKGVIVADLVRIRANKINTKFLNYYLNSPETRDFINSKQKGTTRPRIKLSVVRELPVHFPNTEQEQKRIVKILDEVFEKIEKAKENTEKNLQNSKELFDICLQNIFLNGKFESKKLQEIAEYFNGLTYSPKDVSDKGIIVLRSSNVQNDKLDFSDIVRVNITVKEKLLVKTGDILMCSRNGSKRLVGKTAKIDSLKESMTFGTFMMIIRSKYNSYLSWFFKSSQFRTQISGGENTMINQITRYMLDDVIVPFPTDKERRMFVKRLDTLSEQTKKLEQIYQQKLADLEELKKSILQKAFSGEL